LRPTRKCARFSVIAYAFFIVSCSPCLEVSAQQQPAAKRNAPRETAKSDPRFDEVESLLRKGRAREAQEKLRDILAQDPRSIEGYNLLGVVLISEKDYQGASDALQHALKLNPASPRTRNNLGNLYVAQQKLGLAEKE